MLDMLIMPFQFSFMTNAFWIMAIVSVPTSLLSCYLVLKGWFLSFLADRKSEKA